MIKIKDFGIDLENNSIIFFEYNNKEYKTKLRDVCDALADQRLGFEPVDKTEEDFLSEAKKGYSIALQEVKWNMLHELKNFEVKKSKSTKELITYKDNFVKPYNIEIKG